MDRQWLKGPELVKWCGETGIRPVTDSHKKRFKEWGKGGSAHVHAVDRIFTYLERALGEIPDEIYVDAPKHNKVNGQGKVLRVDDKRLAPSARPPTRKVSDKQRETIRAAFAAGVPSHTIAEHFHLNYYKIVQMKGDWHHGRYGDSNSPG